MQKPYVGIASGVFDTAFEVLPLMVCTMVKSGIRSYGDLGQKIIPDRLSLRWPNDMASFTSSRAVFLEHLPGLCFLACELVRYMRDTCTFVDTNFTYLYISLVQLSLFFILGSYFS